VVRNAGHVRPEKSRLKPLLAESINMGTLSLPNGAVYLTGASGPITFSATGTPEPAASADQDSVVSKEVLALPRSERVIKAREYRSLAERTRDHEVRDWYAKMADELERANA
jgi:hypothetical protein